MQATNKSLNLMYPRDDPSFAHHRSHSHQPKDLEGSSFGAGCCCHRCLVVRLALVVAVAVAVVESGHRCRCHQHRDGSGQPVPARASTRADRQAGPRACRRQQWPGLPRAGPGSLRDCACPGRCSSASRKTEKRIVDDEIVREWGRVGGGESGREQGERGGQPPVGRLVAAGSPSDGERCLTGKRAVAVDPCTACHSVHAPCSCSAACGLARRGQMGAGPAGRAPRVRGAGRQGRYVAEVLGTLQSRLLLGPANEQKRSVH